MGVGHSDATKLDNSCVDEGSQGPSKHKQKQESEFFPA